MIYPHWLRNETVNYYFQRDQRSIRVVIIENQSKGRVGVGSLANQLI